MTTTTEIETLPATTWGQPTATYRRMLDGTWGIAVVGRASIDAGTVVPVTKKNGTKKNETVSGVAKRSDGLTICRIVPTEKTLSATIDSATTGNRINVADLATRLGRAPATPQASQSREACSVAHCAECARLGRMCRHCSFHFDDR